jgi:hypothetical protein
MNQYLGDWKVYQRPTYLKPVSYYFGYSQIPNKSIQDTMEVWEYQYCIQRPGDYPECVVPEILKQKQSKLSPSAPSLTNGGAGKSHRKTKRRCVDKKQNVRKSKKIKHQTNKNKIW